MEYRSICGMVPPVIEAPIAERASRVLRILNRDRGPPSTQLSNLQRQIGGMFAGGELDCLAEDTRIELHAIEIVLSAMACEALEKELTNGD